ncbi:MAG TPA: hypothetical protein HA224_03500 [Nanoarchaeota archaeon]|nr:hypothetical protein [Nanoarchaeota archaeon]
MLDKTMYAALKVKSGQLGYLSSQELIRDLLREKLGKSELEKFGERIERKIKKLV